MNKNVAIIHYNTPELTEALIQSVRKHGGENYRVFVFDNSDERPFKYKMRGVKVFDNTRAQILDFDAELAKYPDKHYTGIDLTPKMIEVAKNKRMTNVELVVGDCENLPFAENSFDAVICSESFHHYPNPQDFFNSVYRVLRPNGRFILRDITVEPSVRRWLFNHIGVKLVNLTGKGDVRIYGRDDIKKLCDNAGLHLELFEKRTSYRLHAVIRKSRA
jgi:SAM-dependent methyltransferase